MGETGEAGEVGEVGVVYLMGWVMLGTLGGWEGSHQLGKLLQQVGKQLNGGVLVS